MRYVLIPLCLLAMNACLEPMISDFHHETDALNEHEIQWLNRIQRTTEMYGVTDASATDKRAASQYGIPIFEQVFPQMLSDLQQGKLQAYSPDVEEQEVSVAELSERLSSFGSSWQDISPLLYVFHIVERGFSRNGTFDGVQQDLEIIWYDLKGDFPEKKLAIVKVADLSYEIEMEGQIIDFQAYLKARQYYAFPIRVTSSERSYGLRTMDQAYFVREKILNGKWNSVIFLDENLNLAEKKPIASDSLLLESIVGLYEFDPADFPIVQGGAADSIQLYFLAKQGKLEAEWSWRNGEKENLYAFEEKAFFSVNGDLYEWKKEKTTLEVTFYNGKVAVGHKMTRE